MPYVVFPEKSETLPNKFKMKTGSNGIQDQTGMHLLNLKDFELINAEGFNEGPGLCSHLLTFVSVLIIFATLPFSLCFVVKVVQVKI